MPRYTFTGSKEQVFPQYIDKAKASTLVAEPGKAYEIEQVAGLTVPGVPDKDGNPTLVEQELAMPPNDDFKPAKAPAQNGSN